MFESLAAYRPYVLNGLNYIDEEYAVAFGDVNRWGGDLRDRLASFASRGKLIRGSLVLAAADALGHAPDLRTGVLGASLELIQSFLLIHDDIMDEDAIRRGSPAVFEQYRRYGADRGYRKPERFGESMGICAGDVAVLVAVRAVARLDVDAALRMKLVELISREIADVGVAQMADVANGHTNQPASEEEILSVYRYKTGRYTFSLPLMLGAIVAGSPGHAVDALSRWGELQGIIFQIRDDELGVMGSTESIGKPAASDVSADKQTLHRLILFERIKGTEWGDVAEYFGREELSEADVARVRRALIETGTLDELSRRAAALRREAETVLNSADFTDQAKEIFEGIAAYNASRTV